MQEAEFTIQELLGVGFTLVVLGIGLAYGLDVMADVQGDFAADSAQDMAIDNATAGIANIAKRIPTIATIVVAAVVIGILITYLWARFARV